jgi:hypothetical protein
LDILFKQEQAKVDRVLGHGGSLKQKAWPKNQGGEGTSHLGDETAGEGPWGIALLASYLFR